MRKITLFVALVLALTLPTVALSACKRKQKKSCSYEIQAEYFAEGRLVGSMRADIVNNTENAFNEIPFALYGNAFREGAEVPPVTELYASACYYGGESYGQMQVENVAGAASWNAEGDELIVQLLEPLYPDERVELTIDYTLTLANANHRLGVGEHCVNLSYFYPVLFAQNKSGFYKYAPTMCGEPFVLDCADFFVQLTVPEDMVAAAGGTLSEELKEGKRVYTYAGENVRDTAFVLGNFSLATCEREGVQIDYYYFSDEQSDATLKTAADAIATFSELFGQYPYARFAFAETDLFLGGMEYSGFVMLSSLLQGDARTEVVVHETAHQWWYALVSSDQAECAWQDEGLSEYSVALFFERNPAYQIEYRHLIARSEGAYRSYFSVKSQLSGEVNTAMSRPLASFSGDYEYRVLAYDKGVVLFDRLRETMGDKRFFAALRQYAEKYAGEVATQSDLMSCFSSQEGLILTFTEGKCVI